MKMYGQQERSAYNGRRGQGKELVCNLRPHPWRGSEPVARCPDPGFGLSTAPHRIQPLWKPRDGRGLESIREIPVYPFLSEFPPREGREKRM